MDSRQGVPPPPAPPATGRPQPLSKTISDGTNPPVVDEPSQNHHIWRESPSFLLAKVPLPVQEGQRVTAPQAQSSAPRATLRFSLSHWVQRSNPATVSMPPAAEAINFHRDSPL